MFKKMKLASKLAVIIGFALVIVFTGLVLISAVLSETAIKSSIYGELDAKSESNAIQIQNIFDTAGSAAKNMQSYLEKSYTTAEEKPAQMVIPTDPTIASLNQSVIYHRTLSPLNTAVEQYISETARNTVANNEDIAGVGVMFEPYKYQSDIKSYAFYIDKTNKSDEIKPFGEFETYSVEGYYKDAAATKQSVVTDPYEYNGVKMVTYGTPILHDNELQGIIMADINIDNFKKVDAVSERYTSMYAKIYNAKGKVIFDSLDTANVGKDVGEFYPNASDLTEVKAKFADGKAFNIEAKRQDGEKITQFFSPIIAGNEVWWSLTAVSTSDVNKAVIETSLWLIAVCIAALIILLLITLLVLKKMLSPMQNVVHAAESISRGELNVDIHYTSEDEIGILSHSFRKMTETLKEMVYDVRYLLGEMAEGNFNIKTKAESSYVGDFEAFILSIRKLNIKLSETLSQINQSSDQVSAGSDQVSSGAQALSQGAAEQASSVEELAATITEISQQVNHTATNAQEAIQRANETGDQVMQSNQQMQEMLKAMGEISDSSREIGKIIKAIEDIAFQTNILALNAAVEAARAGSAGKGFAVVADEVRNLASKSSESSKSTSALIERSLRAVENGTRIADETARALLAVVDGAQEVTQKIDNISQAANEQASAIMQVSQGIEQISSVVQTNSATAEESAAASEELSSQAQMLKELVNRFKFRGSVQTMLVNDIAKPESSKESAAVMTTGKY